MIEELNFVRNPDCWKKGEMPEELQRNVDDWECELNCGSNAPGVDDGN